MLSVAIGWQVYALSGSAFDLGLVGLAEFLPVLLLTLIVGHVVDRYDRRMVLQLCQAAEAVAAAVLAIGSTGGWLGVYQIFAMAALIGAARSFEGPAQQALLPALVPRSLYTRAVALSSSAGQTAVILGPVLGGLLYIFGPAVVYWIATALFFIGSLLVAVIKAERTAPRREPATMRSVLAGIAFIRSQPQVLGAISLDLFAVLLGGATALLPIYARDILATGPWGLGLLRSAPALGALVMSLLLAHWPLRRRVGKTMLAAVAAFGVATVVFAVSQSFGLSIGALIVLGAVDMISVVVRHSLVQLSTPDEMRGRVSAVSSIFIGTSNQLGEFESGLTAAWLGVVPAVVVGGLGTIFVALIWFRVFPQLRDVDQLEASP